MSSDTPKKTQLRKYFFSYLTVMDELQISRRTLQRWIEDMEIEPAKFEDQMRVFLVLPDVDRLREYKLVMATRSQDLRSRYRKAVQTGNNSWIARLRKEFT